MNVDSSEQIQSLNNRIAANVAPLILSESDRWVLVTHLGSGGSANVWHLNDSLTNTEVAWKSPRSGVPLEVLYEEQALAQQLQHPNLIQTVVTDSSDSSTLRLQEHGTFWELLDGGSLEELVRAHNTLSLAETVTVVLPMAQLLGYLHGQQVVHGDISPMNILFDIQGRPVLSDLGSVRAIGHAFAHDGTPGFVAPEILKDPDTVEGLGAPADIYSLGAIGWFCLTATVPGPAQSRIPLNYLRPDLDPEVVELLEGALSPEPLLRPTIQQIISGVAAWSEPQPVDLYPCVSEHHQLLLPTRKPHAEGRNSRRKWFRKHREQPTAIVVDDRGDAIAPRRRRYRVLVPFLASLSLGIGLTLWQTDAFSGQYESATTASITSAEASEQSDFQVIVDRLAKARSSAWKERSLDTIQDYAQVDSPIFEADQEAIQGLLANESSLDGIRMRGEVTGTEFSDDGVKVHVTWRTDAYDQLDANNSVVKTTDARIESLTLVLVDTSDGMRIRQAYEQQVD